MYTLQVLNDANEWELIVQLFKTQRDAIDFFCNELHMFADFDIVKVQ